MELYAYSLYNYYFIYQLLSKRFSQLSINDSLYYAIKKCESVCIVCDKNTIWCGYIDQ